jgi:hypothetical protein
MAIIRVTKRLPSRYRPEVFGGGGEQAKGMAPSTLSVRENVRNKPIGTMPNGGCRGMIQVIALVRVHKVKGQKSLKVNNRYKLSHERISTSAIQSL